MRGGGQRRFADVTHAMLLQLAELHHDPPRPDDLDELTCKVVQSKVC